MVHDCHALKEDQPGVDFVCGVNFWQFLSSEGMQYCRIFNYGACIYHHREYFRLVVSTPQLLGLK